MNALKMKLCVFVWAASWASGCGSDDKESNTGPQTTIATSPLSGVIGGQPWSLGSAETDEVLSDEETFVLTVYGEPSSGCDPFFQPTKNELILITPKVPGDYAISLARAATFVVDPGGANDNLIALSGRLVIDEVTATSLRGGIAVEYNASNHVNGQFEATICPPR